MYTSIIAATDSLRELLRASFRSDVGPDGLAAFFAGTMDVSLATPREMQGQGLSMWLYRVMRDDTRLNDPPVQRPVPGGGVELVPTPLPMRLHYLMTPLVDADDGPDTEQRILGRVLQLFHMHPVVSGADLRGDLTGTNAQIHVRLEALSLDETSRMWEALEGTFQLCVSYEVTLVNIDNLVLPMRAPLVESMQSGYGLRVEDSA